MRLARSHGMSSFTWDRHRGHSLSYDVTRLGYNYRIDEMRAALGLVQLARLPEANFQRRELTRRYREQLRNVPGITLPFASLVEASACHLFPLVLPPREPTGRFHGRPGCAGHPKPVFTTLLSIDSPFTGACGLPTPTTISPKPRQSRPGW